MMYSQSILSYATFQWKSEIGSNKIGDHLINMKYTVKKNEE